MHYHSRNVKTKIYIYIYIYIYILNYDVMMMSSSSPWVEQPWFWLYKSREGKKNSAKKLSNFQHKQPVFHHQTLIHQSWLKICTKTHKRRAIRNPSFRNPINWVPKTKRNYGFSSKRCFIQVSHINFASKWRINIKRKKPQKLTSRKPWLIQKLKKKLQLKCHPWLL